MAVTSCRSTSIKSEPPCEQASAGTCRGAVQFPRKNFHGSWRLCSLASFALSAARPHAITLDMECILQAQCSWRYRSKVQNLPLFRMPMDVEVFGVEDTHLIRRSTVSAKQDTHQV